MYLLTNSQRAKSVNDIMPMIGNYILSNDSETKVHNSIQNKPFRMRKVQVRWVCVGGLLDLSHH